MPTQPRQGSADTTAMLESYLWFLALVAVAEGLIPELEDATFERLLQERPIAQA